MGFKKKKKGSSIKRKERSVIIYKRKDKRKERSVIYKIYISSEFLKK